MSQDSLFNQVDAAVARKGLDQQKLEGQDTVQLIDSARPTIADGALGNNVDTYA